jgi:hypothetical protein
MRSPLFRQLLPVLLLLPLLSAACSTRSTPASIARIERPTLPTAPAELGRTERLAPIAPRPTGQLVTIDKGVLRLLSERLAEAAAAIERGNARIGGWKTLWQCTGAILGTGQAPKECSID